MALKDKWVDKVDGVDIASADDINQVAGAVIELENKVESGGVDGEDGFSPVVFVEKIDGGNRVVITDAKGDNTFDVMDGADGQDGQDGVDGKDGTSVTVESVNESTEDGGSNVVKFSDGKTLTVKNGRAGTDGKNGKDGTNGKDGADGKDYVLTEADKTEIAEEAAVLVDTSGFVAKNQGADNVGKILVVGTDGNLTLTDMPEGGASGDVVGTLDESNNILLSGNLASGTYTLKYENADGTYTEIGTLEVSEIVPDEPSYTNLATTFKTGWRFKSDGSETEQDDGCICENYIPFTNGTIVRIKGFGDLKAYNSIFYDANKTLITAGRLYAVTNHVASYTYDSVNDIVTVTSISATAAFIRVSGVLTGTTGDVVVTVNEPIV